MEPVNERRNFELKARCRDLAAARAALLRLDIQAAGVERQTDTYFHVPAGRLKLREIEGQAAVLIWYDRGDEAGARVSRYRLAPVPDPLATKALLADALGIRGVVQKRRELFLWHNVRIHLDLVDGLGPFIELEAVLDASADVEVSRRRLEQLGILLAIQPDDRVGVSSIDLCGR